MSKIMSNINIEDQSSINKSLLTVGDVNAKRKGSTKAVNKSLTSRSGRQFESVDHYVSETIVQNFYPKNNNQEDFNLIEKSDDSALMYSSDKEQKLPRIS